MPIFATAGSKVFIGAPLSADFSSCDFSEQTEADFAGQAWVQICNLESIGSLGDTAQEVNRTDISSMREIRMKGVRSAGTMEMVMAINYESPGQQALLAAEKENQNYAFKVEFPDAPAGGTPSMRMFGAMVGSFTEVYDDANSVMNLSVSLWVNTNVVRINAAGA